MEIRKIILNDRMAGYIGLARRSRAVDQGYESVRRGVLQAHLAFILIDESITENSIKKVRSLIRHSPTKLMMVCKDEHEKSLFTLTGYKILGMHRGGLANGFMDQLKQENQWQ